MPEATTRKTRPARRVDPMDHQGLVRSVAKYYQHRGLELDDLIQEGQIGLLRACELFDESRGLAFSTYAVRWIKQAISRATMERGSPIHLPSRLRTRILKEAKRAAAGDSPLPPPPPKAAARLRDAKCVAAAIVVGDHCLTGTPLSDLALDRSSPEDGSDAEDFEALGGAVARLPDDQRRVIEMRYGLTGERPASVRATARRLGLGERTVRSSEVAALRRLRQRLDPAG